MTEKYNLAYKNIRGLIERRRKENIFTALGYTSNLDLISDFSVERLNQLLEEHFSHGDLMEMDKPEIIKTTEDMLSAIVYYCRNGIGGEVAVENVWAVENSFDFFQAMGGTGVQAAMALSKIGCPSLIHLTDDSKEVCNILESEYIYTVSTDGKLIHTDKVIQRNEQEIHFIIQFKKGDKITLGDKNIVIPRSNRLILTQITVNETVPFSDEYFKWIETNAEKVTSNVMSSFNCVFDENILMERIEHVKKHMEKYRENNPEGIIFFEDAHYHSNKIKEICLEKVYPLADIVSMNEDELAVAFDFLDYSADYENIISIVEGVKFIKVKYGVGKGIILHTKDYSMYIGEKLKADIETGLIMGNLLAAAKTQTGQYGTMDSIKSVLDYDLSEKGIEAYETIKASKYADDVILVPSKYIDKPKYTIGLGDSFVGGLQICF